MGDAPVYYKIVDQDLADLIYEAESNDSASFGEEADMRETLFLS